MKFFILLLALLFIQNCSFDNKTGIWKNSKFETNKKRKNFEGFEDAGTDSNNSFNKVVSLKKNYKFSLSPTVLTSAWTESYFDKANNYPNFSYLNNNNLIFQSKKLSRKKTNKNILFQNEFLITSDSSGNIIVYSFANKKILHKYNFYKKKYKKIKKKIYYVLKNNFLYISDNLGYLYAYNYVENKVIWAKKFKTPFRSNIKIDVNKLFLADENNNLLVIDASNGNTLRNFPTEQTLVKNNFINNISINKENLFFLNTFGSLYSININSLKLNWFTNINPSLDTNLDNLFFSNEIKNFKNDLIISTKYSLKILDSQTARTKYDFPIKAIVSPAIVDDYIFIISDNNLLISIEISSGKIIYAYKINEIITNNSKLKNKDIGIRLLRFINNSIFIFLDNSYIVKLSPDANFKEIYKLPQKIQSNPIFLQKLMLYISHNNKLIVLN